MDPSDLINPMNPLSPISPMNPANQVWESSTQAQDSPPTNDRPASRLEAAMMIGFLACIGLLIAMFVVWVESEARKVR